MLDEGWLRDESPGDDLGSSLEGKAKMANKIPWMLAILLLALGLAACCGEQQPISRLVSEGYCNPLHETSSPVYFQTIYRENDGLSGLTLGHPNLSVLQNFEDIDAVEVNVTEATYKNMLFFKPKKEIMIVVFHGTQPTVGNQVIVQQAYEDGDRLVIQACFPGPYIEGMDEASAVLTNPYAVILVDRSDHPWKEVVLSDGQNIVDSVKIEEP